MVEDIKIVVAVTEMDVTVMVAAATMVAAVMVAAAMVAAVTVITVDMVVPSRITRVMVHREVDTTRVVAVTTISLEVGLEVVTDAGISVDTV
ncbi:hypothetical protein, partial [Salmonella sp. s55004]|uniref:hypothetical protein n=1 Tax=Salmonella sp. s55004 TaxID=3159675 RepID=UPI0039816E02